MVSSISMAKSASKGASATDMVAFDAESEPLAHGGDLAAARRLFPAAPRPFVDLSTGINPHRYRLPRLPADAFARLPDADATAALAEAAALAYGAPSAAHVVAAPGTQILLPIVTRLAPPGRAAIVTPSYGEFARAAALAGHDVATVRDIAAAGDARLVLVGNPNNPDGRLFARADLVALAKSLRRRGGLLVVDEAFMDAGPAGESLTPDVAIGNIIVLRSFGKFFGLAGLRLGFALAAPQLAARIAAVLGPWAVSGPALAIGTAALGDKIWIERTRKRLAMAAKKLDAILSGAGLDVVGGTSLFRLVRTRRARAMFDHLGRAGILVRRFPEQTEWLRFGLPADPQAWRRLQSALAAFHRTG
jgi:cobalamin biosynthesis protein CobC